MTGVAASWKVHSHSFGLSANAAAGANTDAASVAQKAPSLANTIFAPSEVPSPGPHPAARPLKPHWPRHDAREPTPLISLSQVPHAGPAAIVPWRLFARLASVSPGDRAGAEQESPHRCRFLRRSVADCATTSRDDCECGPRALPLSRSRPIFLASLCPCRRSPVMTDIARTDELFFTRAGLDRARIERLVGDALKGADDGELFLEYNQSEALGWDDGKLKSASFDTTQGFGLRSIAGEAAGYAHASELSEDAIRRAAATVKAVHAGHGGSFALPPRGTNRSLYSEDNPLSLVPFERKVSLLAEIDAYVRAKDPRVRQVMASISGVWQAVQILRPDGARVGDIRPLVRLGINVVVGEGDR